jgi:hypothetical protein
LAPVIGAKERQFMKKKIIYTDEPLGDIEVIAGQTQYQRMIRRLLDSYVAAQDAHSAKQAA